uniref:Uncharacterized protein n=1 Tax=Aegilops tauschii subsp. strangulata TaxID=200361 RepID=A0A453TBJ4_AEGTS
MDDFCLYGVILVKKHKRGGKNEINSNTFVLYVWNHQIFCCLLTLVHVINIFLSS